MSELRYIRYGNASTREILTRYIGEHPGCSRGDLVRDLPSISCESTLYSMLNKGQLIRGTRPDGGVGYWLEAPR